MPENKKHIFSFLNLCLGQFKKKKNCLRCNLVIISYLFKCKHIKIYNTVL